METNFGMLSISSKMPIYLEQYLMQDILVKEYTNNVYILTNQVMKVFILNINHLDYGIGLSYGSSVPEKEINP